MDKHRYRIFSKQDDPQKILDYVRENYQRHEIEVLDKHLVVSQNWEDDLDGDELDGKVEFFPYGEEQRLENWITDGGYEHSAFIELEKGFLVHTFNVSPEYREEKWDWTYEWLFRLSPLWFCLMCLFALLLFRILMD